VVLSEAQWNSDKGDVSKPRSFERHISKSTKPHPCFYNNDYTYLMYLSTEEKYTTSITKHYAVRYYKEGIEDKILERWSKEVRRYHFEALNGIYHWEVNRIDFFKAGMSAVTEGNVFSDLGIKSVVRIGVKKKWDYGFLTSIVVRRSDDKEYEFSYADLPRLSVNDVEDMYLLQVQDKLHHLLLEFVKDFNNALLMFIRRTVIMNTVEDIQLRVESYQRTLNITKPTMLLEGIDLRIPFTMTATHKGSGFHGIRMQSLCGCCQSRFGGNVETKKMQKILLKVHGAVVPNENANQKFLRALPSSWNNVALIMRNKDGIDDLDIDDLYNNLKCGLKLDIKSPQLDDEDLEQIDHDD
ncbi:hypothetical protein Tco_1283685, partial [Tanacetum coccineum]